MSRRECPPAFFAGLGVFPIAPFLPATPVYLKAHWLVLISLGLLVCGPSWPAMPMARPSRSTIFPDAPTRTIGHRSFVVSAATCRPLRMLARSSRATPSVVCVAAEEALLSRAGGFTDLVLSTTLSAASATSSACPSFPFRTYSAGRSAIHAATRLTKAPRSPTSSRKATTRRSSTSV